MEAERRQRRVPRVVLSVLFLGLMFYLLKGREQDFSLWAGMAMAAVFIGIGLVLDFLLTRRH